MIYDKGEKMNIIKLFATLILLIGVQSCKDSSTSVIPIDNFIYPLKTGNQWTYNVSSIFSNFRPDSIKNQIKNDSVAVNISVTGDTIISSQHRYEMRELRQGQPYPVSYAYYSNEENGFIKYGYSNIPSLILPKSSAIKKFEYNGIYFDNVDELVKRLEEKNNLEKVLNDSIIYFETPRIVYAYPLIIGKAWIFSPYVVKINKEVIGKATVKTAAGIYECYKIRWKYNPDSADTSYNNIIYDEYLCSKGLLKIEIIIKDIIVTSSENPDGIGMVDLKYEKILTSINF